MVASQPKVHSTTQRRGSRTKPRFASWCLHKEIWAHLLAYNLLRTVMAVAATERDVEPRTISLKGVKQAVTAFAPKIEAARPEDRAALINALLAAVAYHRVGDRPGRWEPRARKRRPKPGTRLMHPRAAARLPQNRSKYFYACHSSYTPE